MDNENTTFKSYAKDLNKSQALEDIDWVSIDKSSSKKFSWYLIFIASTIVLGGLIYLITRDLITTIVIVFCGIILLAYSIKKPKSVNYKLTDSSLYVSGKAFKISNFKSFSINNHGLDKAISLVPMKRFYPYLYINLNQDVSADVIQRLSQIIPVQKPTLDIFESLLRFIKL